MSFELVKEREDEERQKPCQCDDVTTKAKKAEVERKECQLQKGEKKMKDEVR